MSLRWRGHNLICGAKSEEHLDDTYIDDRLHYHLSLILRVIVPDENEETNGLWHWIMDEEGQKEYDRINTFPCGCPTDGLHGCEKCKER